MRQGFQACSRGPPVLPAAAPFGMDANAEEAQIGGLLEQLTRKDARVVPLLGVGRDLLAAEALHGLPDQLVLFGEIRKVDFGFLNCGLAHCESSSAPIWTSIWPRATPCPGSTRTATTIPLIVVRIVCSIFIASRTTRASPAFTC